MKFDKEQIVQFDSLLDKQRNAIFVDTKTLLKTELAPIKEELYNLQLKADDIKSMLSEDIEVCYKDIDKINKTIRSLQLRISRLESVK